MIVYCATTNPGKIAEFRHGGMSRDAFTSSHYRACGIFRPAKKPGLHSKRMQSEGASLRGIFVRVGVRGRFRSRSRIAQGNQVSTRPDMPDRTRPMRPTTVWSIERLGGSTHRAARFICVIALVQDGALVRTFRGSVEGEILSAPRGEQGFGYDPLFYYPPFGCSFGEVPRERKQTVSHRGAALKQLAEFIQPNHLPPR